MNRFCRWGVCLGAGALILGGMLTGEAADLTTRPERTPAAAWARNHPHFQGDATLTLDRTTEEPAEETEKQDAAGEKKIYINLASRELRLFDGNKQVATYPVGVGMVDTPTPVGDFHIIEKEKNPKWIDPDDPKNVAEPGEGNPLGQRWMGIGGHYGIHGTNRPSSIGGYVSHGCVRMLEKDVEQLYPQVEVNTPVSIYYDRVVVHWEKDHTISYSIYPDGYKRQPSITVDEVKQALSGYGVADFASRAGIEKEISRADGSINYVGKAYTLYLNGVKQKSKAIRKDGVTYIPASLLSSASRTMMIHRPGDSTFQTPMGTGTAVIKSGVLYCTDTDAEKLFHMKGTLGSDYVYRMESTDVYF